MKKIVIIASAAFVLAGCQTRFTLVKNAEVLKPVEKVEEIDGQKRVVTVGYERAAGGYEVTARSPSIVTEGLKGMKIGVTGDEWTVSLDEYQRDWSKNYNEWTHNLVTDFSVLAEKAIAAYASCGATLAGANAAAAVKKAIASYIVKGGDASKAKVTCENGNCTFSDGTVTEVCPNCAEPAK